MQFYITDEERMDLFEFISKNNGFFVPKLIYDTPKIKQIQTKEELIKCIYAQVIGFFILSPCFQIEPLTFHQFDDEYEWCKFKYSLNQRTGGPYIAVGFFRGFADDAPIKYKCTEIFYYARYLHYDWETNFGEFPATEELKAYYKMIVNFLKSKCRQIIAKNGKKYWVSRSLSEDEIL